MFHKFGEFVLLAKCIICCFHIRILSQSPMLNVFSFLLKSVQTECLSENKSKIKSHRLISVSTWSEK